MAASDDSAGAAKQEAAYLLGTTDLTQQDVAEKVEVSARTIRRWLEEPEFQAHVLGHTRRMLCSMSGAAASRIRRMLRDARDRDAVPLLRIYLTAIGLLRDEAGDATGSVGPVILPADSPDWQAYALPTPPDASDAG